MIHRPWNLSTRKDVTMRGWQENTNAEVGPQKHSNYLEFVMKQLLL